MCGCAMAVRDDGQMAVLGDEDLAGLPSSGGPWRHVTGTHNGLEARRAARRD